MFHVRYGAFYVSIDAFSHSRVDGIFLLRLEVPIGFSIRVTNPNTKKG